VANFATLDIPVSALCLLWYDSNAMPPDDTMITATHEAGHAVAARVLNVRVTQVQSFRAMSRFGYVDKTPANFMSCADLPRKHLENLGNMEQQVSVTDKIELELKPEAPMMIAIPESEPELKSEVPSVAAALCRTNLRQDEIDRLIG